MSNFYHIYYIDYSTGVATDVFYSKDKEDWENKSFSVEYYFPDRPDPKITQGVFEPDDYSKAEEVDKYTFEEFVNQEGFDKLVSEEDISITGKKRRSIINLNNIFTEDIREIDDIVKESISVLSNLDYIDEVKNILNILNNWNNVASLLDEVLVSLNSLIEKSVDENEISIISEVLDLLYIVEEKRNDVNMVFANKDNTRLRKKSMNPYGLDENILESVENFYRDKGIDIFKEYWKPKAFDNRLLDEMYDYVSRNINYDISMDKLKDILFDIYGLKFANKEKKSMIKKSNSSMLDLQDELKREVETTGGFSVSEGTLKEDDIFNAIRGYLNFTSEGQGIIEDFEKAQEENDKETMSYLLNESAFNYMNEIAPEGYYFGSHPGDGADIGFWENGEENDKNYPGEGSTMYASKLRKRINKLSEWSPGSKPIYYYYCMNCDYKGESRDWYSMPERCPDCGEEIGHATDYVSKKEIENLSRKSSKMRKRSFNDLENLKSKLKRKASGDINLKEYYLELSEKQSEIYNNLISILNLVDSLEAMGIVISNKREINNMGYDFYWEMNKMLEHLENNIEKNFSYINREDLEEGFDY